MFLWQLSFCIAFSIYFDDILTVFRLLKGFGISVVVPLNTFF